MFLKKPAGFTLIELMVAMVVGLIVAAIAMSMYVSLIRANATSIQVTRLTQSLQGALDVMERDIRRAGYTCNALEHAISATSSPNTFTIADLGQVSAASPLLFGCIHIRYDDPVSTCPSSGLAPVASIGYRFNAASGAIDVTTNGAPCDSTSATDWSSITNNGSTNVTNLSFAITPSSGKNTEGQRRITISITGNSKQKSTLDMTLQRDVRLRNDEY